MIISPSQLVAHLKNQLGKGYILIGDCPLMMHDTCNQIMTAWAAKKDKMGWDKKTLWIEEGADWANLYSEMQHFSLFSSTLYLDVRFHKKTLDAKGKHCLTQLTQMTDYQAFLLLQAPLLSAKQLTAVQKHPQLHLIEIKPLKGRAILSFIEQGLQKAKINYGRDVPQFIVDYTEGNIIATAQCIEQLILLHADNVNSVSLTLDSLRQSLSDTALFPLYALSETCLQGDPERILRVFQSLKQADTEPLLILWWLAKITRQLYALLIGIKQSIPLSQLFQTLGIWSSQQGMYQQATKRFSSHHTLSPILVACHHIDIAIKSNATLPIWDTLEQVALSFYKENFSLAPAFMHYD